MNERNKRQRVSSSLQIPWHLPLSRVRSSDAAVVMYSITDRASFHAARESLEAMAAAEGDDVIDIPVTLLANKTDLNHLRKVKKYSSYAQFQ